MPIKTHDETQCAGEFCVIHNPSDHHMNTWPIVHRLDHWPACLTERVCSHGIGHPDPDSLTYLEGVHRMLASTFETMSDGKTVEEYAIDAVGYDSVHGCDGCCIGES